MNRSVLVGALLGVGIAGTGAAVDGYMLRQEDRLLAQSVRQSCYDYDEPRTRHNPAPRDARAPSEVFGTPGGVTGASPQGSRAARESAETRDLNTRGAPPEIC